MLLSTFQLLPGFGPAREQKLWLDGIACWDELESAPPRAGVAAQLKAAIAAARAARAARDTARLAALLPAREHWRLFPELADGAAYLDIETSDDDVAHEKISAIGVLDRHGPRLFLAGRDLGAFAEASRDWSLLVTFNGGSYDVPILRRAFPEWQPPAVHLDLRHLLSRLGHRGRLGQLERRLTGLHLVRPAHVEQVRDCGAAALFRRARAGDRGALRVFAEYNLYDAIGLRTLMAHAYNGLLERLAARAPALRRAARGVAVPGRGDVLYDVSKIVLGL